MRFGCYLFRGKLRCIYRVITHFICRMSIDCIRISI
nr:MAG TPA: hypothetical protein [Caudoviricetes sp.]